MAQIKQSCSVTNGSQTVTTAGDLTQRIRKNHIFLVESELVPYTVAANSTYSSATGLTTITLTGNYQGATNATAAGVFAVDVTYPDGIPTIAQGDVGTAAIFSQAMYKLQSMVSAVTPAGTTQATNLYNSLYNGGISASSQLRDTILQAWQAASTPGETMAEMNQQIHSGAPQDVFIYDTSKDADGGAWRKRCAQTSWATESLCSGQWLGIAASEALARGDNLMGNAEDLSAWGVNGATVTKNAQLTADGTPMHLCAVNTTGGSRSVNTGFTAQTGGLHAMTLTLLAGASTTAALGAYNTTDAAFVASSAVILSGPGTLGTNAGWQNISNLSATVPTKVLLYVALAVGKNYGFMIYPGTTTNTTGNSVYAGAPKVNRIAAQSSTYVNSPELLPNGGFDFGMNGWTAGSTASTAVVVNGEFQVTASVDLGRQIYAITGLTVGKAYALNGTLRKVSGPGTALLGVTSLSTGQSATLNITTATSLTGMVAFNATATTMYIVCAVIDAGSAGGVAGFDNLSVKEVTTVVTPSTPYARQAGSYYQNSADGKFYMLGATYASQTEVVRGNSAEFPAVAGLVLETNRLVIYDLTRANCPMWMAFPGSATGEVSAKSLPGGDATYGSRFVRALNGAIYVGVADNGSWWGGLWVQNFITDFTYRYLKGATYSGLYKKPSGLTARNTAETFIKVGTQLIGHNNVSWGLAVTALPEAPTDVATGLPVPTIALGHGLGATVFRHDGTTCNASITATPSVVQGFSDRGGLVVQYYGHVYETIAVPLLATTFAYGSPFVTFGADTGFLESSRYIQNPLRNASYAVKDAIANNKGVTLYKRGNLAANSMVAAITEAYNSGWLCGDVRGAWLADTVAENLTTPELVTNGTFTTDTSSWTAGGGSGQTTLSVVSGMLRVTNASAAFGYAAQFIGGLVAGKQYIVTYSKTAGTASGIVKVGTTQGGGEVASTIASGFIFTATQSSVYLSLLAGSSTSGQYCDFDNVSVKLIDADRTQKVKGLNVVGTIAKTAVASGAQLVGYGGFSTANYLEQPYNTDLDFGSGDFAVMGWATAGTAAGALLALEHPTAGDGFALVPNATVSGTLQAYTGRGGSNKRYDFGTIPTDGSWFFFCVYKKASNWYCSINGLPAGNLTAGQYNTLASGCVLRVGLSQNTISAFAAHTGKAALVRITASVPSDDMLSQIYNDESNLFLAGAGCAIDGGLGAVNRFARDPDTGLLHVVTSAGRSTFAGLRRVSSDLVSMGYVSAARGGIMIGSAARATVTYQQPSISMREEVRRREEARRALAKEMLDFDFDSTTGVTSFTLPAGFSVKRVYVAGVKKRYGSTKDYTVDFDGYREIVNFGTSPGAAWVCVSANRSMQ